MRLLPLMLLLVFIAGACVVSAEMLATPETKLVVAVAAQARVNVDDQGRILSIFNTTDGSNHEPATLNVYRDKEKIAMPRSTRAHLDKLSPTLNWSQAGLIYQR